MARNPKRIRKIFTITLVVLAVVGVIELIVFGFFYMGPLKALATLPINFRYPASRTGETVFYGASNFARWEAMEADLAPYIVQNHGFGGSTDADLIRYANRLLFQYQPYAVFFQTGSNDYMGGATVETVMKNKDAMYAHFRQNLPDAYFVVMSGLPLPGRAELWDEIQRVNDYLREYCAAQEKMVFIDATAVMTNPDGSFRPELFVEDGIHLNRDGQRVWSELIKQALAEIDAPQQ